MYLAVINFLKYTNNLVNCMYIARYSLSIILTVDVMLHFCVVY